MLDKTTKIQKYSLMIELSLNKEGVLKRSMYYNIFSNEEQREIDITSQKNTTERLENRMNTLIEEL